MKKLLVAIILSLCLCANASAYDLAITGTCVDVENSGKVQKCTYSSTISVVQGADKVFLLSAPNEFGNIVQAQFNSTSNDCRVWLDEAEGTAYKAITNIFAWDEIDVGYGKAYPAPRYFRNAGAVKGVYFNISPQSSTATGTWSQTLFFGPNKLGD